MLAPRQFQLCILYSGPSIPRARPRVPGVHSIPGLPPTNPHGHRTPPKQKKVPGLPRAPRGPRALRGLLRRLRAAPLSPRGGPRLSKGSSGDLDWPRGPLGSQLNLRTATEEVQGCPPGPSKGSSWSPSCPVGPRLPSQSQMAPFGLVLRPMGPAGLPLQGAPGPPTALRASTALIRGLRVAPFGSPGDPQVASTGRGAPGAASKGPRGPPKAPAGSDCPPRGLRVAPSGRGGPRGANLILRAPRVYVTGSPFTGAKCSVSGAKCSVSGAKCSVWGLRLRYGPKTHSFT